ncbi:T9SS type A sorting domain-containing protein [Hymenobacter metallilatus]|uniref:T9SS type A sorting domain-containing protein n=1 Tax=Hymenobacter metallilatus TaxID=2493666 RepID=UPI00163B200D|nr:T9SS type A sorting domain-containing protein [Hymenobacter metallilatus]
MAAAVCTVSRCATQPPATQASYTLRNSLGQTISRSSFRGDAAQVSTAGLTAGMYTLSLEADGSESVTHRFLVEK